jgi:hypothetical protein
MSLLTRTYPILLCPFRDRPDAVCKINRQRRCSSCGRQLSTTYSSAFIVKPLYCEACATSKKGGAQC